MLQDNLDLQLNVVIVRHQTYSSAVEAGPAQDFGMYAGLRKELATVKKQQNIHVPVRALKRKTR